MKWNQLDLKIQLSPSQAVPMQGMIQDFITRKQQCFCEPVLEENVLKINSSDFINFLDQVEFGNEFDWFRLRTTAIKAIAHAKIKKRDPLIIQHYQRCEELCAMPDGSSNLIFQPRQ